MDSSGIAYASMHHVTPTQRPRSQQTSHTSGFRHLPVIKDSRDYIMITQDILDAFRVQVVKSHKVNLNLTNVRLKSSRRGVHGRRLFPPLLEERMRFIHAKAQTSLDLREPVRHRPIKVYVDDVTQKYGFGGSDVTSGSGQESQKQLLRKHNTKQSQAPMKRSMDSGDDDEVPDDVIETVARANTVYVKHAPVLPEIRAAPCPLHSKRDRLKVGNDESMEGSFSPFRDSKIHRKHRQTHPIKNISMQQNTTSQDEAQTRGNRVDINVRIPEQFSSTKPPALPKNMSSKDYVMSWLIHGSDPHGSNHFPDIIPNHSKTKGRTKPSPRQTYPSE